MYVSVSHRQGACLEKRVESKREEPSIYKQEFLGTVSSCFYKYVSSKAAARQELFTRCANIFFSSFLYYFLPHPLRIQFLNYRVVIARDISTVAEYDGKNKRASVRVFFFFFF